MKNITLIIIAIIGTTFYSNAQIVTTLAGSTATGSSNGTGTAARFNYPDGVATDGSGNLYVADSHNNEIRKIIISTGVTTTLAGNTTAGFTNGTGTAAAFNTPSGVAADGSGNLFVADASNNEIRKIVISTGVVTLLAGSPTGAIGSANGTGTAATFSYPSALVTDGSGNLYVADFSSNEIRKIVISTGVVTTLAGNITAGSNDGTGTAASFNGPSGITIDGSGDLYVVDYRNYEIRKIVISSGVVTTFAGNTTAGSANGTGTAASFNAPNGIAINGGNLYVADYGNNEIREIVISSAAVTTLAGNTTAGSANGTGTTSSFNAPTGVATDNSGNIYVADMLNNEIREITIASTSTCTPIISTIAGNGTVGYTGNGGQATAAELNGSCGLSLDPSGNIYITDIGNNVVRKITVSTGVITTIAGTGTAGYNGDGIAATTAELNYPVSVFVDGSGNIYIGDYNNNRIRKINSSGIISTVAGNGSIGYGGDGGQATASTLYYPQGVTVDATGNIYIADCGNHIIREVNSSGIINTIAGIPGSNGYNGDGIAATSAQLNKPYNAMADGSGNVYISDGQNNRIRKINSSGIISTVAGSGTAGYNGDGGQATSAELNNPSRIYLDGKGNIYISDNGSVVREMNISSGIINTIAGNGTAGYNGDGIAATTAELYGPDEMGMNASGNLYITDGGNQRIREIICQSTATTCTPDITTGLVAQYNFTGNANDISGNGNNGTVYNATLTTDRYGNANSAYYFNGTNAYIDVPNNTALNFSTSNAMSISFWAVMNITTAAGYSQVMVSKQSGSGNSQTGYDIEQYGGTSFYDGLRVGTSGGPYGGGGTTTTPSLLKWHHYVFTYDGTVGISKAWVDGVMEDSIGGNTAVIGSSTYDLLFGYANWSNVNAAYFNGDLDDIRMYDRSLSSCDVDSIYNMPNPSLTSINSISAESGNVLVYPNPATSIVNIETHGQKFNETIITDLLGRVVFDKSFATQVDIAGFANGCYIITLKGMDGNVYRQRIVKE